MISGNIKFLIKSKNLSYFKSDTLKTLNKEELFAVLKSVGYYRNYLIFKNLYTLLYKSSCLNLEKYKKIFFEIKDYVETHPSDYFFSGFSTALAKSDCSAGVKASFAVMIYDQIYSDGLFKGYSNKTLTKSVKQYYFNDKDVNLISIKKGKAFKITNSNLIKTIKKWNH